MSDDICDINNQNCKKTRFLILLVSLLAFIILEPFLSYYTKLNFLLNIFLTVVLVTSIYAASENKRTPRIAIFLALPKLGTMWTASFMTHPLLLVSDAIFGIVFIGYIIVLILRHIFRQQDVNTETIYGAIVVYILIGIIWVFLYNLTEFLHPQSFSFASVLPADARRNLYHFSFVTLTTLGYGDITPVSGPSMSLAILEAIVGQMYIAVLIARLVGIHISQSLMKK